MSTTRGGPGLSGITGDGGERLTPNVRRRAGTGHAPGSVLITVAAWLLEWPRVAGRAAAGFDRVVPRLGMAMPFALHAS